MSDAAPPLLRLFGAPTLVLQGAELGLGAQRPLQLLAVLACRRDWVPRDMLAEWLWPERSAALSRSNLRTALTRAQAVLADGATAALDVQADRLRWLPDSDLQRFEDALQQGRGADAVAQVRGPLLQGLPERDDGALARWLAFECRRVAALWREAAGQRLQQLADDPAAALALAERVLEQEPLDEDALIALAQARQARGEAALGLQRLEAHADALDRGYGLQPSARLRAMAETLRGTPSTPSRGETPLIDAGFVGRRIELTRLQELLARAALRVVTVVGPGGVGKSALARQAAAAHREAHPQVRVGWVDVETLADASALPGLCAAAFDAALPAADDDWRALARLLGTGPRLLVLDSADHLPGLTTPLAALLAACPRLQLLATARGRLGLAGEQLLPLDGLPLPDADETDAEVLRHNDAVRLFEARAQALLPGFDLGAQAAEVVRLLHAVEGLPLAVEVAATWVPLLPVATVHDELQRSLELLDAPDPSRGVRASFDPSWLALAPHERTAMARLAWLPAPFGITLAREVAQVTLPTLAALVDRSLLRAESPGRFVMHALLRQHARDRAALPADELQALRSRQRAHIDAWLATFTDFSAGDTGPALQQIERELPQVRAAWASAVDDGDAGFVERHAYTLSMFFSYRGLMADGRRALEAAAQRFDEDPAHAALQAHLAYGVGNLRYRAGAVHEAEALARRALKFARSVGDWQVCARCLNLLGITLVIGRNDSAAARPLLEHGLRLAREHGHRREAGVLMASLAQVEKDQERLDVAQQLLEQSLAIALSGRRHTEGVIARSSTLANLHTVHGRWSQALQMFELALAECQTAGINVYQPTLQFNLARCHLALGRPEEALRWAHRGRQRAEELGQTAMARSTWMIEARIQAALGCWAEAGAAIEAALAPSEPPAPVTALLVPVAAYAELLARQGRANEAGPIWDWVLNHPLMHPSDRLELTALRQTVQGHPGSAGPDLPGAARAVAEAMHRASSPV